MEYLIQFLIILFACIVFIVFFGLRDRKEFFESRIQSNGFLGPNFDSITNKDFVKTKCYSNMNPSDADEFRKMGQVCGADYNNWEQYPCIYHAGNMDDEPRCLQN